MKLSRSSFSTSRTRIRKMHVPAALSMPIVINVTYLLYIWMKFIARKYLGKAAAVLGWGWENRVSGNGAGENKHTFSLQWSNCNLRIWSLWILVMKHKHHTVCNPRFKAGKQRPGCQTHLLWAHVLLFSWGRQRRELELETGWAEPAWGISDLRSNTFLKTFPQVTAKCCTEAKLKVPGTCFSL